MKTAIGILFVSGLILGGIGMYASSRAERADRIVNGYRAQIDQICVAYTTLSKELKDNHIAITCSEKNPKKVMIQRVEKVSDIIYSSSGYIIYEGGHVTPFTPKDLEKMALEEK